MTREVLEAQRSLVRKGWTIVSIKVHDDGDVSIRGEMRTNNGTTFCSKTVYGAKS